ncbi:BQ2448_4082 [Microbotryum intermedium]|uniref:BQ2448_4082 protein n=1 Tax=Microbotryum intermedium TaxID=269621 RepID=A0A238FH88_9BASI|nr:BQ2448_4082 [Microbotryum intermedium]
MVSLHSSGRSTHSAQNQAPSRDLLSGHPGHLSVEQQHILDKFKKELAEAGYYDPAKNDDPELLRFLRARKFDIPKAKTMWIDTQNWRKSFKVDELYDTFEYKEKAEVDKLYPRFYHKTDKDGRPLYIEQLGKLDLKKLYEVTTPERQMQSLVVEYEKFQRDRLPVCSALAGQLIETSCTIMDLKGVGMSSFWSVKNYVQEASTISQNNYPERMGKFYIVNASWAFSAVWNLVKGWLDEATVAKIHILSSDYKKSLLEQVPAESLPTFLGGTCQCPQGCSMSDAGPWNDPAIVEKVKKEKEQGDAQQLVSDESASQQVENGSASLAPPVAKPIEDGTTTTAVST